MFSNTFIEIFKIKMEKKIIMISEKITLQRLNDYAQIVKVYKLLISQKLQIIKKTGYLSSFDYSTIKVASCNGRKIREEDRYAISLEKINRQLEEYKTFLIPEQKIIKTQIGRISKIIYRQLLIMRYIYRLKWSKIIYEFFNLEEDFEEEKNDKYKDKIFYWNRQAVSELEKVSAKPYIKAEIRIEEVNLLKKQNEGLKQQNIALQREKNDLIRKLNELKSQCKAEKNEIKI